MTVGKEFFALLFVVVGGWNLWTAVRFGYVSAGRHGTKWHRSDSPIGFWFGLAVCVALAVLGALTLMGYSVGL